MKPTDGSSSSEANSLTCAVEDCDKPLKVEKRRLCNGHDAQRRRGVPFTPIRRRATERDDLGRKLCRLCKEWLPESSFSLATARADGLQTWCNGCKSEQAKTRSQALSDQHRLRRYGMTRKQFDLELKAQGGSCWICGTTKPGRTWVVDHDHACCPGKVSCGGCIRGILCNSCNHGLGHFRDNPASLARAIEYLGRP